MEQKNGNRQGSILLKKKLMHVVVERHFWRRMSPAEKANVLIGNKTISLPELGSSALDMRSKP